MKKLGFIMLFLSSFYVSKAQDIAPFKTGDRIAFVGNSITDGGHYHSYIWLYYMTHFPNMRITCFNAGIGGDVIQQIYNRFDADVMAKNPNVITLTWGMNDTGYFDWYNKKGQENIARNLDTSYKYYGLVEQKLKALSNVRKIFIGGSPYDFTSKFTKNNLFPGKADALGKLVDYQQAAAKRNGWDYVDFYHPMLAINQREQARDSVFSLTPNDRIHPDNNGHMVMAYLFLKDQGLANHPVADISINASEKRVLKEANCRISQLTNTADSLSFNYLANSLPYPLDTIPRGWGNHKSQAEALKLIPWTKEFNQEMLAVNGLKKANYGIYIDGEKIGSWPAEQLAKGINMAEISTTPQYQQAIQIRELNEERWEIERRFRNYMYIEYDFLRDKHLLFKDNNAAMDSVNKAALKNPFIGGNKDNYTRARYKSLRDAWQKEMDVLTDQIYAIDKPQNHRITIIRQK
ncbi:MAG: SGNH/GDSL hydrolase family protein [Janthinobacterium lividum]